MSAATHNPEIYAKSGNVDKHVQGVQQQYDTEEKRQFYSQVMGDGTANIHFGKWDDIDLDQEGAYGKASEQMTDYMFELAVKKIRQSDGPVSMVDLGSGTGGAAVRLLGIHKSDEITKVTCLNLCKEQNAAAMKDAQSKSVTDRIQVETGTYEDAHMLSDNTYDLCFSQDAFVHAFSKVKAYSEAYRIAKSGAVFIFCDLMCGDGPDVKEEELATFAATNMVNDWLTPEKNVKACKEAGWQDVTFVNLTQDIRISFQLMQRKVEKMIERGGDGIDPSLLTTYKDNLTKRVGQVDKGVFKWGVIHGVKK